MKQRRTRVGVIRIPLLKEALSRSAVCIGAMLLALADFHVSAAEPVYRVGGWTRYKVVLGPHTRPFAVYDMEEPFEVFVRGAHWRMRVLPVSKPMYAAPLSATVGWDGKALYEVDMERVKPPGEPDIVVTNGQTRVNNTASCWIRRSPVPVSPSIGSHSPAWMSYCSADYFRRLPGPAAEPAAYMWLGRSTFESRNGSSRLVHEYFRVLVSVLRGSGTAPFDVPQRVLYFRKLFEENEKPPPWDVSTNGLDVVAMFQVLEWTNAAGVTLPRRSEWTTWREDGSVGGHYVSELTNVAIVPGPFDPRPAWPRGTQLIADMRFGDLPTPELMYATNRWLTMEEVKGLPEYKHEITQLRKVRSRSIYQRVMWVVLAVLAIPALVALWRRFRAVGAS